MDFIFVIISILVITLLIVVHEFGHFLAAKRYGFQTPVFGIGMPIGPGINLFKWWGTQFKFYWCLIGGFVAIPELGDETDPEVLKEYNLKPLQEFSVAKRAVVASGGIIFNILFAFLLAVIMAGTIGLPKGVASNEIAKISDTITTARDAGIQVGDKVLSLNNIKTETGEALQKQIQAHANQEITLQISRPVNLKEALKNKVSPEYKNIEIKTYSKGTLGIVLSNKKEYEKYGSNPLIWIWQALKFTFNTTIAMFLSVIALLGALVMKLIGAIVPSLAAPVVDLGEVKGIVGIVQIVSGDIKTNAILLLDFAVLLSLNLAVINVLPIPALDGGHLAFMAYEAVVGKKPSEKIQQRLMQAGFLFLLGIIIITTFNDIKNWICG